ncbi:hypothetical protein ABZP36_019429 [Zizania latifolia]
METGMNEQRFHSTLVGGWLRPPGHLSPGETPARHSGRCKIAVTQESPSVNLFFMADAQDSTSVHVHATFCHYFFLPAPGTNCYLVHHSGQLHMYLLFYIFPVLVSVLT